MKSYNYTQAKKEVELAQEITREQAIAYITNTENKEESGTIAYNDKEMAIFNQSFPAKVGNFRARIYLQEAIDSKIEIVAFGAYPYLEDVAKKLLGRLNIETNDKTISRASDICYQSGKYADELATIKKYEDMEKLGYKHVEEVTDEDHGKTALLKGSSDNDMFSVNHDDDKVKIYCKGSHRGYQKPRMKTRYYSFGLGTDLFIKII